MPLRVEAVRQRRRRRTTLALGFLVLLPFILVGAFALSSGSSNDTYVDLAKSGAVNFTMFTIYASTGFLLVVVVALFFATRSPVRRAGQPALPVGDAGPRAGYCAEADCAPDTASPGW